MSHEENKAMVVAAGETLEEIKTWAVRLAGDVQELQEGPLSALATELAGNSELREAVDLIAECKHQLESVHGNAAQAGSKLDEVHGALNAAG